MYFLLRYIDYEDFKKIEDFDCVSLQESVTSNLPGENKELLVNPDCYVGIILDYIYKVVGISNDMRSCFDLSTHRGRPLNIAAWEPFTNGLNVFTEKSMYYIVTRDSNEQLKPLLYKDTREYMEFFAYLKKSRSSLSKKRSSASKSGGSKSSPQIRSLASKSSKGSLHHISSSKDKRSKSSKSIT